ncbi:MAG: PAS domain S-box protein [Planctomycetes bacterium]|nr:PAS domain S-box protein [Planctomycetota bacterium]
MATAKKNLASGKTPLRRADPLDQLGRELLVQIMQEITRDAVLTIDRDGRITSWNQGAEALLGWPAAEVLGRHFDFLLPEDLKRSGEVERLLEATESHGFLRDWETRRLTKDGHEIHVALTRMHQLDGDGKPLGATAILRDISPRKGLEEELLRARTLGAIGEAAARIAHEIRNPLTGIHNAITLLAAEFGPAHHRAPIFKEIQHEIKRVDVVLDDLLTFARHRPLSRQRVDLVRMLEKVVANLIAAGDLEGVVVRRYFPDELVVVADPSMLEDSLYNLVQNAAHALRGHNEALITLALKPGPKGIAITVTDNGPGITADIRRKIFDPFFTTKAHGTGLGLPITKKHIEAHGGRLRVRSAPDRRTTFEILLPPTVAPSN